MSKTNLHKFFLGLALLIGVLFGGGAAVFFGSEPLYKNNLFSGPAEPGCILVASMDFALESLRNPKLMKRVFLINKKKQIVHSWILDTPPFSVKLAKDGTLWALKGFSTDARDASLMSLSNSSQVLSKLNWPDASHDFDFLPDGKILMIVRKPFTGKLPESYLKAAPKWETDVIQIIDDKTQKMIREYDLSQIVDLSPPVETIIAPTSVLQVNSVRYLPHNPINQRPAILFSARLPSKVVILDFETAEVIWQSPKGTFDNQHDPNLLSNGDLLVFNNGTKTFVTSVLQFNPNSNSIVWKYQSFDREDFFNHYNGSAQRLPNGNTLITVGSRGYVFEVDPEGRKVWEWFNTTMTPRTTDAWPYSAIFRSIQYLPDDPEIAAWKTHCGGV